MLNRTRAQLQAFFAPFNDALWAMLATRCRCVPLREAHDAASNTTSYGGLLEVAADGAGPLWWPPGACTEASRL
ncbi:hypothetical protein EMIHUDRAFT_355537 [Emiliania huxleyi CCMP1516]|uniref:Uncharacterized protein n=2 Tax=Emiliania huxleyi TaxID=2903 RepID=A0A0D3J5J6_EMIH1|nr:hypothetical protein EMIHUDRAFT_355537 [Emiliania huxleyi CCMP1516]EOD18781.1 hypothetical protein EMIHUDRAFT_355537 [Emiliania huxleyi CCMP1516]|eukprot:XP_005771210.1 hypothetical protein EMIHUDRAFT_355537 [Emiliania huxleyi CCMP1516]